MRSTAENLLLWEQRIKEKVQSGMALEEWCKKNGTSKYQYYYWNRRVHKKQKLEKEMPFADITPIFSNMKAARQEPVPSPDFQVILNDIRVIVPSDFNPVSLSGLMKVLQAL